MAPDGAASLQAATSWPNRLLLVGAGRMGGAMLRGWLAHGLPPEHVSVVDPGLDQASADRLRSEGVEVGKPGDAPDAVVLAVKPQNFESVAAAIAPLVQSHTFVLSILAGRRLAGLRAHLPAAGPIVRAMPNLPAAIGLGATGVAAEAGLSDVARQLTNTLLGAIGAVVWVDELHLDAVTAVSGSGPAYVFALVESMTEAAVTAGLPRDTAALLARATVEGAGALLRQQPEQSAAELRKAVTSPGGTTAAALAVLEGDNRLTELMRDTVAAAARRAGELAN